MQTIQIKVNDNYVNTILSLLNNLKKDMIQELMVINNTKGSKESSERMILNEVKGIFKDEISDPVAYQRALRDEWERD